MYTHFAIKKLSNNIMITKVITTAFFISCIKLNVSGYSAL